MDKEWCVIPLKTKEICMKSAKIVTRRSLQGALGLVLAAGLFVMPHQAAAEEVELALTVTPQADTASHTDGVDSYRVEVINQDGGGAKHLKLTIPFAPGYTLASASFEQEGVWVSDIGNGAVTISIDRLEGADSLIVSNLSFTSAGAAAANAITERATVTHEEYSYSSNMPGYGVTALNIAGRSGSLYAFGGGAFAPNESVNFWYTSAAGVSTPLYLDEGRLVRESDDDDDDDETLGGHLIADGAGVISTSFDTSGLPAGSYTLAARGDWTGAVAAVSFVVP
jgi:hypothetical protein